MTSEPITTDSAGGAASDNPTSDSDSANGLDDGTSDDTTPPQSDPATPLVPVGSVSIPDPLVQNSTVVNFDITVPAYVSNALQVTVVWGTQEYSADWVGDEYWSATGRFPTNTEHELIVTFFDNSGAVTLGSFTQIYTTGNNESELYSVTANQFDTDRWDNDNDGVSNIDELNAVAEPLDSRRVLLFSETRNFRHSSIPDALITIEALAASVAIQTDRANDSEGVFTDSNLERYDAVAWVLTSGDVLNANEQAAFERYIRSGGGYLGIHAASDTEYSWPWYGALVGAYFDRHPEIQTATQVVEDESHLSTAHLNSTWTRTDEWYDYRTNPRAQVNVLLSLDEGSYSGGRMGNDHPSAWYQDYDNGKSWYTGGGHTTSSYAEPEFRAHLLGGLRYVTGSTR